jgi:hypothetical protein
MFDIGHRDAQHGGCRHAIAPHERWALTIEDWRSG